MIDYDEVKRIREDEALERAADLALDGMIADWEEERWRLAQGLPPRDEDRDPPPVTIEVEIPVDFSGRPL